jgi:hypothetical protein
MRFHATCALAAALLVGPGCARTDRTYLPVRLYPVYMRIPSQQVAVSEAAKKATASLNFADYSGKSALVEITGVFPHSHQNLLDYIQALVEGRMALDGMAVTPAEYESHFADPTAPAATGEANDEVSTLALSEGSEARTYKRGKDADYRVVICVGAAGANLRVVTGGGDQRFYDGVVRLVVMLIPLKPELKAASFEANGTAEQQVDGAGASYTDDVFSAF